MKLETPPEISWDAVPGSEGQPLVPTPATPSSWIQTGRTIARFLLASAGCALILAAFVPIDPLMPGAWSDMSWMMAMNQAVAQGLVFGRDIVFTFGPYASVYSEVYHPATDPLMVWASLSLALGCLGLLYLLAQNRKFYALAVFGFILAAVVNSRDALLLSYSLLLSVVISALVLPRDHPLTLRLGRLPEKGLAILFAPLGLLALVKVSLLPVCGTTALLCGLLLWHHGKKFLACAGPATSLVAAVLLWVAARQPLWALPKFCLSASPMISGYTEAMEIRGSPWEWILYVLASVILLIVIWTDRSPKISRLFLLLSYAMFLFLAFKIGFVRHNPWHNVTASSSILIAAFLLLFVVGERRALPPLALAALACALIGYGSIQNAAMNASLNLRVTAERSAAGVRKRLTPGALQREYDQHLAAIRAQFPIDRLSGTTDIYSMNQSWLFASGNTWSPRPAFQSYSAYTAELAELNLRHLTSPQAPDNIVFRVEPIDNRLPSIEDGLSWPAIIDNYSLAKLDAHAAYLRKRDGTALPPRFTPVEFDRGAHQLGEQVSLPDAADPLFAKVDIHLTLLGRAWSAAFKPPQLHITLRLRSGEEVEFRTVSTMMNSEFLLTPLVKSTDEFARLASGEMNSLAGNPVKSFSISSDDSSGLLWNRTYALSLARWDRRSEF